MNDTVVIFLSAVLAAASFMAIALPFLNRQDKKERYQSVIDKKRKNLFAATKENLNKPTNVSSAIRLTVCSKPIPP